MEIAHLQPTLWNRVYGVVVAEVAHCHPMIHERERKQPNCRLAPFKQSTPDVTASSLQWFKNGYVPAKKRPKKAALEI